MSKKMLIAGPWVGEFGWELFCWQGVVRKASKDYDAICIIARPGKQAMYIDILDDFGNLGMYHEYHCGSNLTNAWKIEGDVPNPFDVQDFLNTEKIQNFIKENEITEEYTTTQTIPAVAASTGTGTAAATREVN